ncbi:MAG: FHA domain-containing protein, partial [Planctomyces sp.]
GQDIAILADISRHHATIQKLDEHWLIHPHRNVVVNGKTLTNTATVHSDDELCLNGRVRLKFRIPNAVAGTALLEFMSVHRTPWNVNGIILMSDFCLIGSKTDHHIVCTEWSSPVILYRQNHEVCVRSEMPLEIDHQKCTNGSAVSGGQIVSGTDLRFRLERIS